MVYTTYYSLHRAMPRKRALSFSAFSVLYAITHGHRYGFDIMEATGQASGSVYPVLSRLERDGLVRARWESEAAARREGRPARKYYELTAPGERALAESLRVIRGIEGTEPEPSEAGA
jgi:PadR family transcriptional regulator PadR